jgi:hypothetical protein
MLDSSHISHWAKRKYARVEAASSAVNGSESALVDAGLAFGRSFRVGWGPAGSLVLLGKLCGPKHDRLVCLCKLTALLNILKRSIIQLVSR